MFNAWSVEHDEDELRANSMGDLVHRPDPRILAQSLVNAMDGRSPMNGMSSTNTSNQDSN